MLLAAQKEGGKKSSGPAMDARKEMSKSKEQVEEEMKISLSIRIKPLDLDSMDSDELRNKANQIWNTIVGLETDKYDYEQRHMNQDYEFKELAERQKIQLRNKAVKKGLDPESFTGAHPPKIRMFSKYERRTDTRTYGDRKKLYEGGCEVMRAELLESLWKEKFNEWSKRPKARLPKWFGERPGKKAARSCGQNCWNLSGKKSLTNGPRGQRQDFQNGLANVLVKRLRGHAGRTAGISLERKV